MKKQIKETLLLVKNHKGDRFFAYVKLKRGRWEKWKENILIYDVRSEYILVPSGEFFILVNIYKSEKTCYRNGKQISLPIMERERFPSALNSPITNLV